MRKPRGGLPSFVIRQTNKANRGGMAAAWTNKGGKGDDDDDDDEASTNKRGVHDAGREAACKGTMTGEGHYLRYSFFGLDHCRLLRPSHHYACLSGRVMPLLGYQEICGSSVNFGVTKAEGQGMPSFLHHSTDGQANWGGMEAPWTEGGREATTTKTTRAPAREEGMMLVERFRPRAS